MDIVSALRKTGVIRRGRFVLKSGKRSDVYVDMKKAWGNPTLLRAVARAIATRLPRSATCIAASGYGGLPLGAAVSLASGLPLVLVRESPKKHGRGGLVDGYVPKLRDRVVLVDDVYTSGTGMRHLACVVRRTRARIVGRFVVIDRLSEKRHDVHALARIDELLKGKV